LKDEQATYGAGTEYEYTPKNFENEYFGQVTAREALQHSLNNATISLASMVGFDRVAELAAKLASKARAELPPWPSAHTTQRRWRWPALTPSLQRRHAPGALDAGQRPHHHRDVITDYSPDSKQILDPRVAYLTVSLMENVIDHGTGAVVRARGFLAPAAGKTGTSHDAWFAGFTSNLLCIVWVGNDDYTDVNIEGAHAAAPIWAEFMKKAVALPQYSDTNISPRPKASISLPSTGPATCSATPPARTASMPHSWQAPRPRKPATTRRAPQPDAKTLWRRQERELTFP